VKRVILDSCEYISAPSGGHKARRLLHMAIDGEIETAISEPIITETVRVLWEKCEWPPYDLLAARERLQKVGRIVDRRKRSPSLRTSRTAGYSNAPPKRARSSSSARTRISAAEAAR
jgi:hypothetical protein